MNILILGEKRSGKDTIAEFLAEDYGLTHMSSSMAGANKFIFEALKPLYGYTSIEECFEDRHYHRKEWFDLICDYNKDDLTRLAKEIMKEHDIYVGMRNNFELQECKRIGLFDVIIGVIRPDTEGESKATMDIDVTKESDILIYNDSGLDELRNRSSIAMQISQFDISGQVCLATSLVPLLSHQR